MRFPAGMALLCIISTIQVVRVTCGINAAVLLIPTQMPSRQRLRDAGMSIDQYGFSLASGMCWGSIILLPLSDAAIEQIVVQAFVLAGLSAGAALALSLSLIVFASFVIPAILPFIVVNRLGR